MVDADDGSLVLGAGGAYEGFAVEASVADDNAFALRALSNAIKEVLFSFGETVTAFEKIKTEGQGAALEDERRA